MKVGSEIKALCRKCGETWHIVIALAGREIAKVECVECGAGHRYRSARDARAAPGSSGRTTASRSRSAAKKPIVAADESRPPREFRVSETYAVADRIVHPSFGEGVVQEIAGPSKIVVFFAIGSKTLVQGRGAKRESG